MWPRFRRGYWKRLLVIVITLVLIIWALVRIRMWLQYCRDTDIDARLRRQLVFIGGMPRSGTTLMRAILDVHPMVRCGEETIVVPKLSGILKHSIRLGQRYREAKISEKLLQKAIGLAILTIIEGHGAPARILCNKDPLTMRSGVELSRVFTNSKFIFMIRDGRAVVNSLISRGITVSGFNLSDYGQCLRQWSLVTMDMHLQCKNIGVERCFPVKYENLVLHPRIEIARIVKFLGIPWNPRLLKHHVAVGDEISVSKLEWSNDQIAKPINTEALSKWVTDFPIELRAKVDTLAPALAALGYDPRAFPPKYGKPDELVKNNTLWIEKDKSYWSEIVEKFRRKK